MRPTQRPAKPYTNREIIEKMYQHFVIENNPQCKVDNACYYGKTGCAVGCLMTLEDADIFDNYSKSKITHIIYGPKVGYIYDIYFTQEQLHLLNSWQELHDDNFESFLKLLSKEMNEQSIASENRISPSY